MELRHTIVPVLGLLLLLQPVMASSLATFPYQTSKNVTGRNASFEIGAVNLGNETLTVNLSTGETDNIDVVFPENQVRIEPSDVDSNPRGSGWYYLGNDRYGKVTRIGFKAIFDEKRVSNTSSFKVFLTTSGEIGENDGEARQKVVQVREYNYRVRTLTPGEIPVENEDDGDTGSIWRSNGSIDEESSSVEDEERKNRPAKDSNTSRTPELVEGSEVDGTTILLSIGALASIIYLYKVI